MADVSRYEDSYSTRNFGGANKGVLDLTKANGEVNFFSPKPDNVYKIDIVSYVIKTKNHPRVAEHKWKVGETDYRLDIYVHNNVGPSEATVVCPKNTYGKPCPICDAAEEAKREGKKEEYAAFKAKRIVFYNVIDRDNPTKGIQIFKASHWLFEHELIDEAKASGANGTYVDFANEKNGYYVQFRGATGTMGTREFTVYKGFKFYERKEDLTKMVAKAHSFDDMLIVYDAKKILKIMNGEDDEDEVEILDVEDTPEWVTETETMVKEAEAPKEESENPCPHGHVFGVDNDKFPNDCDECSQWKQCARAGR